MTRRRAAVAAGLVLAVAATAGGGAWAAGLGSAGRAPAASPSPGTGVRTVAVARKTLQVQASLSGTLAYGGSMTVAGRLPGTITWIPNPGALISRGGVLYEVDGGRRAILMLGDRPAWRGMQGGRPDGVDVQQLERNLHELGYLPAAAKIDGHWDRQTTDGVKRWQKAAGMAPDGVIDFGEIVFLPSTIRVTTTARLGTPAGGDILTGTTDTRLVALSLEATRRRLVAPGLAVTIALPDGSTTGGHVHEIGRVAHVSGDTPGSGSVPTIDVTIALDDPAAAPQLDQAPVSVRIVTSSRPNVLAVPVNALVALLEGGYAVEVVATGGSRRYVAVGLGLFDSGWVELASGDVHEGDLVVVPS